MNIKTLENSLFWQKVVLNQSKDKTQIERVKKAIAALQQQIDALTKAQSWSLLNTWTAHLIVSLTTKNQIQR